MTRAPTFVPLTKTQELVALMLGMGRNYTEIGEVLHISALTAKRHADDTSRKIPGDLPTQMKLAVWVRGATLDVLEGASLKQSLGTTRVDDLVENTARPTRATGFRS